MIYNETGRKAKMEMSCVYFPLCADEFVSDRLIPLLSLQAVNINTVKFPGWFIASNRSFRSVS